MSITRVQGNARGTTTNNSITVSIVSTPTNGNVLVACIGSVSGTSARTVSSITETNVTWTKQANITYSNAYSADIWLGVVGASASKTVTIALSGNADLGGVADICEYSGVLTSGFLDKTATWSGNSPTTPATGTTATTTQNLELWIGCISLYDGGKLCTQSSPTNSFTLLDGVVYQSESVGFLEYIVNNTGAASSAVTSNYDQGCGCIATFKGIVSSGQQLFTLLNEMGY